MTHITCRLTAKNRDQLQNPTLGNRVWATFTFFYQKGKAILDFNEKTDDGVSGWQTVRGLVLPHAGSV